MSALRSRYDKADPILKVLGLSTLIGTLGRGVFLTVTVLYFSFIVGLSAAEDLGGRRPHPARRASSPHSSVVSWPTGSAPAGCC